MGGREVGRRSIEADEGPRVRVSTEKGNEERH